MNKQKSFTLIELLVVIVIIGILAGVIMISTSSSINKANFAKAQAFSETVKNELLLDLVSEWSFDNLSNPGEDSWGNNNGTLSGTTIPEYQNSSSGGCVFGGCINFSGYDYIDYGSPSSLNFDKNDFTVSFWIKALAQDDTNGILGKRVGNWSGIYPGFEVRLTSSSTIDIVFADGVFNTNGAASISNALDNEWHYIVYSFDRSSNIVGYLDGSQAPGAIRSISALNQSINNNYNFEIGRTQNNIGYSIIGMMDEVMIYNTILLSLKIKQNYIAGLDSLLSQGSISKEDYDQRINALAYEK